jgi:hypothetical protein
MTHYRLLNPGEVRQAGDETFHAHRECWLPVSHGAIGLPVSDHHWPYRRPLPPCQCEALEAAISIETAEKQAAHSEKAAVERQCEELRKALEPFREVAAFYDWIENRPKDAVKVTVTLGDCRRAAEVLNTVKIN